MRGPSQIAAACRRALARHGCPVTWHYQTVISGTLDPTTGSHRGGVVVAHSGTCNAFVHVVGPATSELSMMSEVQRGDIIIDLPDDAPIDGIGDVRFEVDGELYVQQRLGVKMAQSFDVTSLPGGRRTFRTVLARKAT